MSWLGVPLVLCLALLIFFVSVRWLRHRYPVDNNQLVDLVDALLPQTQCAQCGFAGCRPYAEALVANQAATNLCPPGGAQLHAELENLLQPDQPTPAPDHPAAVVALIDETECIGCTLCLPPCPVDAIVGAQGYMHTVTQDCTGCELCIPACPVDCISLVPAATEAQYPTQRLPASTGAECIACGQCNPVCPVALPAQQLLYAARRGHAEAQALGLDLCIECGLCNKACPSDIPMAALFNQAKADAEQARQEAAEKARLKHRFEDHLQRQQSNTRSKDRHQRLRKKRVWQ